MQYSYKEDLQKTIVPSSSLFQLKFCSHPMVSVSAVILINYCQTPSKQATVQISFGSVQIHNSVKFSLKPVLIQL